jgi:hypothetical protein
VPVPAVVKDSLHNSQVASAGGARNKVHEQTRDTTLTSTEANRQRLARLSVEPKLTNSSSSAAIPNLIEGGRAHSARVAADDCRLRRASGEEGEESRSGTFSHTPGSSLTNNRGGGSR